MQVMSLYLHDKQKFKTDTNLSTLDSVLCQSYFLVLITVISMPYIWLTLLSAPEVHVLQQVQNSGSRKVSEILLFV